MPSSLEYVGYAAAAIAVSTVYVLVHEARRKKKKASPAIRAPADADPLEEGAMVPSRPGASGVKLDRVGSLEL